MILYDEPDGDYRKFPAITYSSLKVYQRCPLLYYKKYIAKTLVDDGDTEAKMLGRAAHCLILEGQEKFESLFTPKPATYWGIDAKTKERVEKPWTRNATFCAEWEAEQSAKGFTVLSAQNWADVERWALAFEEQPEAAKLLLTGRPEVGVRVRDTTGQMIQGRLDWLDVDNKRVWDLKTVDDLANFEDQVFRRRMRDAKHYYYYRQLAWYRGLLALELGPTAALDWSYSLVAVEKVEPFRCGVYRLKTQLLDLGESENEGTYRDLLASLASGYWPGNPAGVLDVDLPLHESRVMDLDHA